MGLPLALEFAKHFPVIGFDINEERTVCATIQHIHEQFHNEYQLAFANGGDQNNNSIREVAVCEVLKIELFDGLGYKIQSSSWLLN